MSKVLIDFSQIPNNPTGVGYYAHNLLLNNVKNASFEYGVLVQSDSFLLDSPVLKKIKIHKVPSLIFRNIILRVFLEQILLPVIAIIYDYKIIHSLHYSFPLFSNARRVVTIHDLTFFLYPEYHQQVKIFYFKFFIHAAKYIPEMLIFISTSSEADYLKIIGGPRNFSTIPLAAADSYNPNVRKDLSDRLKLKYNLYDEYILTIGTIEPRKNLSNLAKAFDVIYKTNKNIKLVIVGKNGWFCEDFYDSINKFESLNSIIFTGYVNESEKLELLGGAKCFVYASFYEGFGLPILESISCGVPTVTSNISSMPEVVSSSALLVDPHDVNAISAAISKIITNNEISSTLSKLGVNRSHFFSWEKTSSMTIDAYLKALSGL